MHDRDSGRKKRKGNEHVLEEIMAENLPGLKKEIDIQIEEAQNALNKINPNRLIPRHIIIKVANVKERILKAAKEQELTTREPPKGYQLISLQKHCRPEGSSKI